VPSGVWAGAGIEMGACLGLMGRVSGAPFHGPFAPGIHDTCVHDHTIHDAADSILLPLPLLTPPPSFPFSPLPLPPLPTPGGLAS